MNIQKYISKQNLELNNKKVIITGANSGIGFAIAKLLVESNSHVIFACRNEARARKAMEEILKEYPKANLDYIYFDQSSFESIDKSIEALMSSPHLDFDSFIFNAGVLSPESNELNPNNLPITIATNYINVVYFLEKFEKLIDPNKQRRFIFQSSLTARMIKPKNILDNKMKKMKQYSLSKYCLTNYKNYKASENNSNNLYLVCEPGITKSNIIRNFSKLIQVLGKWFLNTFMMDVSVASLNAIMCVGSTSINSGDEYRPRGLFSIGGKPKLFHKNNKINKDVINVTLEIINRG